MQDQFEETTFESRSAASDALVKFHKLNGIFWAVVALMGAGWVGHLAMSNQATAQGSVPSDTQLAAPSFPTAETKVYAQGLGKYHWHAECPLASAKSLRPDGSKAAIHRTTMTAMQAEQQLLIPCLYCVEVKS